MSVKIKEYDLSTAEGLAELRRDFDPDSGPYREAHVTFEFVQRAPMPPELSCSLGSRKVLSVIIPKTPELHMLVVDYFAKLDAWNGPAEQGGGSGEAEGKLNQSEHALRVALAQESPSRRWANKTIDDLAETIRRAVDVDVPAAEFEHALATLVGCARLS